MNNNKLNIEIGNTSKKSDEDRRFTTWRCYVRCSDEKRISSVTFRLHNTFNPNVVKIERGPFEIERQGWGSFDVNITVETSDGKSHKFVHTLTLDTNSKKVHEIKNQDPQVDALVGILEKTSLKKWNGPRMTGVSHAGMHGIMGNKAWTAPRRVVTCDEEARPGYNTMKAHEYAEEPDVLKAKIKLLAQLILQSKTCTAYTGAGISTASGIDDYASKAKGSVAMKRKKVKSGFDAQPTLSHRVLASLFRAGHLKHWVQQNHDGLPQKAGFPPEHLNEIHGAWYDPSNPVVPMTGSLRDDLMNWLLEWERKADLVLAMGTSLCGMNADRVVTTCAQKCVKRHKGLGAVIVSLQRTQYDEISSLRIYAKIDEVMAMLAKEMSLHVRPQTIYVPVVPKECVVEPDVYRVPYDSNGRLTKDKSKWQVWDLRKGSEVKITGGPGIGYVGVITGKRPDGQFRVTLPLQRQGHMDQGKVWSVYVLGSWWLETAVNGRFPLLPVVNTGRQVGKTGWKKKPPIPGYHVPVVSAVSD
jgi:NAD-dependent SIR2 family protein deacetylase